MLSYATRFLIKDQDMHLSELQQEGRERIMEMTLREGFSPAGETSWAVVDMEEGPELLGVTPVEHATKTGRLKRAG